ncbi:MAG: sialate O-acetylesterase [Planctomycetota bacterium]|jgi:hypothetical protein
MKRPLSILLVAALLFVVNIERSSALPKVPAGYQKYKPYDPVSIEPDKVYGPARGKKIKLFILSGQSNMVGQGASYQLDDAAKRGSERVLMFEGGKWQPLRPLRKNFGPEIAFGREMARVWPDETIGIVKQAVGGTGVLAWNPNWTAEQADRTGDARKGNLWKALTGKVHDACAAADCEIVGFVWLQGGKDMQKVDTGKEYGKNLKALVQGIRAEFDVPKLPFVLGSYRSKGVPDDLSGMEEKVKALIPRQGAYYVLQAQYEAEKKLTPANMVPLVDIERHPNDVHFNTAGQLETGRLFAEGYLELLKNTEKK